MSYKRPGNRFLYRVIGRKISRKLVREKVTSLPSISDLAVEFRVSVTTVKHAVNWLDSIRETPLKFNRKDHSKPGNQTSADLLSQKIKERIQQGVYRAGSELPKSNFFILEERVSSVTVSHVFKRLAASGLIHKKRKQWIVGPAEIQLSELTTGPAAQSTALIFVPDIQNWHTSLEYSSVSSFVREFIKTLENCYGIKICVVFKENQERNPDKFHFGKREIFQKIKSLGDRYIGTLIYAHPDDLPDIADWIDWFAVLKKPVVWFDNGNAGRHLTRKKIPRKNYYHCFTGENNYGARAIDTLVRLKHRVIAIPQCILFKHSPWFIDRMAQIKNAAAQSVKNPQLLFIPQDEPVWQDWGIKGEGYRGFISVFQSVVLSCKKEHPGCSTVELENISREALYTLFPSLASIAQNPKITAIIAPNQWCGLVYYYWFLFAGFEIPDRISILGFDNYTSFAIYPVSTFDSGFESLGYSAAHLILGDIPIQVDRWGNVSSTPQLIDRGSLGAASLKNR